MIDPKDVKSIFSAAAELPAGERAAYLDEAAAGDAGVRARVEALLRVHDHPDSFLDEAAAGFAASLNFEMEPPLAERPGTLIGPYKLLEQIGEGGMGVVYMADQQAPVRRRVALKIIKAGMDTRQVIARFEAERQALALMDHTNIARVLDAGATDSGRPYFVMELVRGAPITEYCNQNNLPVHERLELFVQVCHAVQHAHQKGIIHRDLKPTNVLVTVNDGRPVPKVIDFGVAKATGQQLTEKTLFTAFAQMVGTPLYMSPEQAEMTSVDVDTRSDIYSLGVLLYELLTGTTPFDQERLRTAAFDEIRRIIREEEPPTPSTRISTLGEARTATAAHRQVDSHRLSQLVEGDLDWIVMKALDKDRTRRYETAVGLAEDIGRYLSDEPVHAGRPTRTYRLKKFIRRNKAGVLAGSAIVAALSVGLAASLYFAASASREAKAATGAFEQAEVNRRLAEGVNAFFTEEVFGLADPNRFDRAGISLIEALDIAASKIDQRFPDDPALRAVIRDRFGEIYRGADEPNKGVEQLREAYELRRSIAGDHDPSTLNSGRSLGYALYTAGRFEEAREILEATWKDQCEQWGAGHPESLKTSSTLCTLLMEIRARAPESDRDDRDLKISESSYRLALATHGPYHLETLNAQYTYAWVLRWRDLPEQALEPARAAATGLREVKGDDDVRAMYAAYCYASCLYELGRFDEAEAELKPLLATRNRVLGPTHVDTLFTVWRLAVVLRDAGKVTDANAVLDVVYEHRDDLRRAKSVRMGRPMHDIAWAYITLQRYDRAAEFLSIVYEAYMGPGSQSVGKEVYASYLNDLAVTLSDSRQPELRNGPRAVEAATRACELTEFKNGPFLATLADAEAEIGTLSAAEERLEKSLTLTPDTPKAHASRALVRIARDDLDGYRAACAAMTKQFAAPIDEPQFWFAWSCGLSSTALEDLRAPLDHARTLVEEHPQDTDYLTALGILLYRARQYDEAIERLTEAIAAFDVTPRVEGLACYPRFFLAMSYWQLGNHAEARHALAAAQIAMDAAMKSPPNWRHRAASELFRRDAEGLIQPVESTAPSGEPDPAASP